MSSRQLEEIMEARQAEWVAERLGISVDDLTALEWELAEMEGHDGATYGYRVEFGEDSDPEILASIKGLRGDRWIAIGYPPEEPEPDFD